MSNSERISMSFAQILELVKQLPLKEKIRLSQELERETKDKKLSELLNAFRTDELTDEIINEEVEIVRQEIYDEKRKNNLQRI